MRKQQWKRDDPLSNNNHFTVSISPSIKPLGDLHFSQIQSSGDFSHGLLGRLFFDCILLLEIALLFRREAESL